MKNLKWIAIVLISLGIIVLLILVYIAAIRDLSGLESILLQIILLAIGSSISFFIGQKSAREAAKEIIKPHARSAFRRLLSLYRSLSWTLTEIKSSQSSRVQEDSQVVLAKLEAIVTEQLATADDALEDWSDIVPEDVAELKQKLQSEGKLEIDND